MLRLMLIVNVSSLGLRQNDPMLIDPCLLNKDIIYCDIVYPETKLMKEAKKLAVRL